MTKLKTSLFTPACDHQAQRTLFGASGSTCTSDFERAKHVYDTVT
jgi:hypothetical protein